MRLLATTALAISVACAAAAPIPAQWDARSHAHPIETDRAVFGADVARVRLAIERELAARRETLLPAEPPYDFVTKEIPHCEENAACVDPGPEPDGIRAIRMGASRLATNVLLQSS